MIVSMRKCGELEEEASVEGNVQHVNMVEEFAIDPPCVDGAASADPAVAPCVGLAASLECADEENERERSRSTTCRSV